MPNVKISELPAASTPLAGTELVPVVQGGATEQVSVANLTAGRAVSASALTASSGNLTFSGTAQRITGDMSNATVANRLMFQTSTVNANTSVAAIPNGTSVQSNLRAFNNSDPTNASFADIGVDTTIGAFVRAGITGTGTYLPMTFHTGGSERVRIDTSGNVGIGVTPGAPEKFTVGGTAPSSGAVSIANAIYATSPSATTSAMYGYRSAFATAAASFTLNNAYHFVAENATKGSGSTIASQYGFLAADLTSGTNNFGFVGNLSAGVGKWNFYANGSAENFFGGPVQINANLNISAAGARIIGDFSNATASNRILFQTSTANSTSSVGVIPSGTGTTAGYSVGNSSDANNAGVGLFQITSSVVAITSTKLGTGTTLPITFVIGAGERMRIDTAGNIVAGASAALATNATDGFLYVPTCAGTPTGVPTAIAGMAPIVVNTTNNKLYFYSGGAWRDAGP